MANRAEFNETGTPSFKAHYRNADVDTDWLDHVEERTLQLDRFGNGIRHFDVEISHNANPSRRPTAWRVEISAQLRTNTIRATGQATDPQKAFAEAREVMEANLRRAARRMHYSRHRKQSTRKVGELLS